MEWRGESDKHVVLQTDDVIMYLVGKARSLFISTLQSTSCGRYEFQWVACSGATAEQIEGSPPTSVILVWGNPIMLAASSVEASACANFR